MKQEIYIHSFSKKHQSQTQAKEAQWESDLKPHDETVKRQTCVCLSLFSLLSYHSVNDYPTAKGPCFVVKVNSLDFRCSDIDLGTGNSQNYSSSQYILFFIVGAKSLQKTNKEQL